MRLRILIIVMLLYALVANAQERKKIPLVDPAYRGFSVHADIASPIMGIVASPNTLNVELLADVNLYDRFFPVMELGYTSLTKEINESTYSINAPFFRFGMNFNIIRTVDNKGVYKENRSYAYLGVRYAFSVLDYALNNVKVENNYWGTTQVKDYTGSMVYSGWVEVHGGVRVDLAKGFTMGWSVGLRFLMHTSEDMKQILWYVPGYGKNNTINFSFKYTVGYTFKTKKAKELLGTKIVEL